MGLKKKILAVLDDLAKKNKPLARDLFLTLADVNVPNVVFTETEIAESLKIDSIEDANNAVIHYDADVLLSMPKDIRDMTCRALLALVAKYNVPPNPLWQKILGNPDFYEKWSNDEYGDQNSVELDMNSPVSPTTKIPEE